MAELLQSSVEQSICVADWADHGQLAVCTGKYVQLVAFRDGLVPIYGALSFEDCFPKEESIHLDGAVATLVRKKERSAVKSVCWFEGHREKSSSKINRLAILEYGGRVAIMELLLAGICAKRSWRKRQIIIQNAVAICRGPDLNLPLVVADETGKVIIFSYDVSGSMRAARETRIPHLKYGEVIVLLRTVKNQFLLAATSHGRLFNLQMESSLWTNIGACDDGLLQPIFLTITDSIFFGKFNHIYKLDFTCKVIRVGQIENQPVPLVGLIPEERNGKYVLKVYTQDHKIHVVDEASMECLDSEEFLLVSQVENDSEDSEDDDGSDEETEASGKGAKSFSAILPIIFHAVPRHVLLETIYGGYPRPDKVCIHFIPSLDGVALKKPNDRVISSDVLQCLACEALNDPSSVSCRSCGQEGLLLPII